MKQSNESQCPALPLKEQMEQECIAMAKHAYASGCSVPANVVQVLETITTGKPGADKEEQMPGMKDLNIIHARLSRIISPAKPRTILLLDTEARKKGYFKVLGPVPFIRRMVLASVTALLLFLLISLSPDINDDPKAWDMFNHTGMRLLVKEFFLLCAAALGASFTALFTANRYIVRGTFDPKYESSYWIRFILGVIAGMIMASLIPIENYMEADFGKPLLAMLGGFSANMLYQVINRLVDTVGSLFKGDTRDAAEANEEKLKAQIAGDHTKNQFNLAADLMKIQDLVQADTRPEEIKKMISGLTRKLTDTEE
jgi:hypothetical protein